MAYPFRKALRDEFRTLRLVLRLSQAALDEHHVLRPPTKRAFESWDHADQVLLEATNEQLLRILDGAVMSAYSSLRTGLAFREVHKPRAWYITQLAEHFRFKPESLPGWESVGAAVRDANATKHRSGVHYNEGTGGRAQFAGTVSMERALVRKRMRGIESWLKAFADQLPLK